MVEVNKGDKFIAKGDYLDMFKNGEEYEVTGHENCLGDDMYFFSLNGRVVNSGWGLKNFEIEINFKKK